MIEFVVCFSGQVGSVNEGRNIQKKIRSENVGDLRRVCRNFWDLGWAVSEISQMVACDFGFAEEFQEMDELMAAKRQFLGDVEWADVSRLEVVSE